MLGQIQYVQLHDLFHSKTIPTFCLPIQQSVSALNVSVRHDLPVHLPSASQTSAGLGRGPSVQWQAAQ